MPCEIIIEKKLACNYLFILGKRLFSINYGHLPSKMQPFVKITS